MSNADRIALGTQHPGPYRALLDASAKAEKSWTDAGLDPLLIELVRLRASQINGCAFCLRMHTRDALTKGEDPDRIAVLPAWAESAYFSDVDRAALELTEAITRAPDGHVPDALHASATAVLTAEQVSAVAWVAIVINALNRVAITSRYHVGP
ncbi:MAG TPA: carboxymuconolactone decarboxylase family protein [Promicromonospora sp.]|nr:carboxymuconolactone decarboxylase family protein [Promicromonospora sp.]